MAEKTDKQKLGESSVPQGAWRKFHKVTPLADAGTTWLALGAFIAVIIAQIVENQVNDLGFYIELITPTRVLIGVGILLGLTAIFVGVSAVMWRHKSYAIVPSGVHYRNGIVMKKYQHVRWDRVQSVEVEQRLFARIFGFGAVKVDAAGLRRIRLSWGCFRWISAACCVRRFWLVWRRLAGSSYGSFHCRRRRYRTSPAP